MTSQVARFQKHTFIEKLSKQMDGLFSWPEAHVLIRKRPCSDVCIIWDLTVGRFGCFWLECCNAQFDFFADWLRLFLNVTWKQMLH